MEFLYDKCRDIVLQSTDTDDEEIIDVLTVAFMGLYSSLGYVVLDNLPKLLEEVEIDRKSGGNIVLNIDAVFDDDKTVTEKFLTYPEESFEDEYCEIVIRTIFELIHLLRFKGVNDGKGFIEIKNGLGSKKMLLDSLSSTERGMEFEEAITSYFAKCAFNELKNYLEHDDESGISFEHREDILNHKYFIYDIRTKFIEMFMEDSRFKDMIQDTFSSDNIKFFSREYNEIMENDAAFSNLLSNYSKISSALNSEDEEKMLASLYKIMEDICTFRGKPRQYKKD